MSDHLRRRDPRRGLACSRCQRRKIRVSAYNAVLLIRELTAAVRRYFSVLQ